MDQTSFRKHGHELVDWIADYLDGVEKYPIKPPINPGDIISRIPKGAPLRSQSFDQIMQDFQEKVLPGVVHWQHPGFMAYFPANSSPPSILAEMLTAALGNQCMIWDTSPAAAELEERMMQWLQKMLDLPETFTGVIQDTASTATLCALLTAREQASNWEVNHQGMQVNKMRVYASAETHSSIEKGVKIAGFGSDNYVPIPVDESFRLDPEALELQISADLNAGYVPCCVVATLGTTGVTALDPIRAIAEICQKYEIWCHVDAAYAGTALALPEYRWMADGLIMADSFVFNPHKWMFTNFDCTAYYVKDPKALVRTFEILPEYLKTDTRGPVNNYRDWGIPLGRRFRALKLWFVIRSYGVQGIQEKLRLHISLAQRFEAFVAGQSHLKLMAPRTVNLVCFRYDRPGLDAEILDDLNRHLLYRINASGHFYLTHTVVNGAYTIRVVIGQTNVTDKHVAALELLIRELLSGLT